MSSRWDQTRIECLFAESQQLLERISACDVRLEASLKEGQREELSCILLDRQQALDQLQALGQKIEKLDGAAIPDTARFDSLREKVQRMAELAVTRNRIYVTQIREQISALRRELSIVQNEGALLRRYVGQAENKTEFNG